MESKVSQKSKCSLTTVTINFQTPKLVSLDNNADSLEMVTSAFGMNLIALKAQLEIKSP